jgi:hypothetical protein
MLKSPTEEKMVGLQNVVVRIYIFFSLQYCINTFPKSVQHIKSCVGYESTTVVPAALRPLAVGAISWWRKSRMIPYCIGSVSISYFCYLLSSFSDLVRSHNSCDMIWGSTWNIVTIILSTQVLIHILICIYALLHHCVKSEQQAGHIPVSFLLFWLLIWGNDFKRG